MSKDHVSPTIPARVKPSRERGAGLVLIGFIAVAAWVTIVFIVPWIKGTRDARKELGKKIAKKEDIVRRGPGGYMLQYGGGLFDMNLVGQVYDPPDEEEIDPEVEEHDPFKPKSYYDIVHAKELKKRQKRQQQQKK